jgi:hypothetical protein
MFATSQQHPEPIYRMPSYTRGFAVLLYKIFVLMEGLLSFWVHGFSQASKAFYNQITKMI